MSLGNNIKQLRLNRGITQEQLHISGQAVSKCENNTAMVEEKYGTRVYSIITDKDVKKYISC